MRVKSTIYRPDSMPVAKPPKPVPVKKVKVPVAKPPKPTAGRRVDVIA